MANFHQRLLGTIVLVVLLATVSALLAVFKISPNNSPLEPHHCELLAHALERRLSTSSNVQPRRRIKPAAIQPAVVEATAATAVNGSEAEDDEDDDKGGDWKAALAQTDNEEPASTSSTPGDDSDEVLEDEVAAPNSSLNSIDDGVPAAQYGDDLVDFSTLPGYHTTTLTHIYIPFFAGQIPKLKDTFETWWTTFPPCSSEDDFERVSNWKWHTKDMPPTKQHPPRVVIMIGRMYHANETKLEMDARDVELKKLVRSNIHIPPSIQHCFHPILKVCIAHLRPEEDDHFIGSRMLFERMLRGHCIFGTRGYGLYMEPDLRPVKRNWLAHLSAMIAFPNPPRWAVGSMYRGIHWFHQRYFDVRFHINFNGLVRLSNFITGDEADPTGNSHDKRRPMFVDSFAHFYFQQVRTYVVRKRGKNATTSFDLDFTYYLRRPRHIHWLTGVVAHRMQFSNAFVNLMDTEWTPWTVDRLYGDGVVMVHGGIPTITKGYFRKSRKHFGQKEYVQKSLLRMIDDPAQLVINQTILDKQLLSKYKKLQELVATSNQTVRKDEESRDVT